MVVTALTLSARGESATNPPANPPGGNPLLTASSLPFQAPPFDKIKDVHFAPAFDEAIKQHTVEIDAIANNPAAPTFENVLVALEKSGQTLTRVYLDFNTLSAANTNDTLQKLLEVVTPKLAAHQDSIYLNAKLFARLEALYTARDSLKLDPESKRLVEYQYQEFVMAGAKLSDADKTQLKKNTMPDMS